MEKNLFESYITVPFSEYRRNRQNETVVTLAMVVKLNQLLVRHNQQNTLSEQDELLLTRIIEAYEAYYMLEVGHHPLGYAPDEAALAWGKGMDAEEVQQARIRFNYRLMDDPLSPIAGVLEFREFHTKDGELFRGMSSEVKGPPARMKIAFKDPDSRAQVKRLLLENK